MIDVGVHDGTPWLYRSFPDAHFVLVDPQAECEAAVRAGVAPKSFDFRAVALGAEQGKALLSIPETEPGKGGAMASLKDRTDNLALSFSDVAKREVPVITLDMLAADMPGRLGLKIDTEGFEYEVLRGGSETLKRCEFVILEMSVTHRFEGVAPLLRSLLNWPKPVWSFAMCWQQPRTQARRRSRATWMYCLQGGTHEDTTHSGARGAVHP